MSSASQTSSSTSLSLIERVRRHDELAWERLVRLYGPLVYRWARKARLQDSDAADLLQDVFSDVAQGLPRFRKDRPTDSFRGWLWTITRNRLSRFFRQKTARAIGTGGSGAHQWLEQIPEVLVGDGGSHDDTTDLVHRALELIRDDFEERTWQAFWRLTMTGESAAHIGGDLQLTEKAVRQAKYRVLCRLRQVLGDD